MSSTSITKRKLEEALSVLDNITSGAVAAGGEGLTAKYKVELSISHEQPCSWREHPCDASIYIFPNVGPASRSAKFEQTVQALTEIGDQLPVTTHPLTTDQLDIITIADPAIADSRICATASALALFGWVPHTVAARHALRCELCLRVVGLWSCRALKDEPFKESEGTDGVLDEQRNAFDVVMEHRGYCPWVEGGVEAEVSVEHVKPGWERTLEALVKRRGGEGGGDAGGKESVTQVEDVSAYIRGLLDGSIGATVRK
ncbi:hypothetical protein BC938DRAFT_483141 [Jimgerdemannia flammicorona]|uniref:C3HC zinc finger-like-domain-containing protein n=1 Tax=Jimgerdemannia flammicorona TaxID=994334 RepID=A0A433QCM7_9FUNG|nr:hypothetical protein BC938DRAFT_483141 [Jimgerdemannia flammicorona]